jgi:hypothetical protein
MTFAGSCRTRLLATVLLSAALCLGPSAASAQSCSADSQCPNAGRSTFQCIGDTLIVRRSVCSGTCREIEERRQNCGPRVIGTVTCSGNIATRTEGGCNPSLGTCDNRLDREVCVPACSCRGKRLTVATGTCVAGAGCARSVVQCENGCTCSPEPRCR